MKIKEIRKTIALILFLGSVSFATAQGHYMFELGVLGGVGNVMGDANNVFYNKIGPLAGGFFKYTPNGYVALTAQFDLGSLEIASEGSIAPSSALGEEIPMTKRDYTTVSCLGEFNFFNYAGHPYEPYHSSITPYLFGGLGVTYFDRRLALTLPMGVGAKYKITNRLNLGLTWTMSKVFNDSFDGIDDPIGLNEGSTWLNRDWYSTVAISFSMSFLELCAPCHNGVIKL